MCIGFILNMFFLSMLTNMNAKKRRKINHVCTLVHTLHFRHMNIRARETQPLPHRNLYTILIFVSRAG